MEQTWAVSLLTIRYTFVAIFFVAIFFFWTFCSHLGQKGGKRIRIVIYFFFLNYKDFCHLLLQQLTKKKKKQTKTTNQTNQTNKKQNRQENTERKSNQDSIIQLYYLSGISVGRWLVKANCIFYFELQISQKLSLYWQLHSGGLDHKIQIISYSHSWANRTGKWKVCSLNLTSWRV